jgi:hypothetical protein
MNKVLASLKAMNNSPWTTIGCSFFVSGMCLLTAFRLLISATPMWIGEVNIWLSGLLFGSCDDAARHAGREQNRAMPIRCRNRGRALVKERWLIILPIFNTSPFASSTNRGQAGVAGIFGRTKQHWR